MQTVEKTTKVTVVIIEDKKVTAREIKYEIKMELKLHNYSISCLIVDTYEQFSKVQQEEDNLIFIVDINLGGNRKTEGLKILEHIQNEGSKSSPIVFTATDSAKMQQNCTNLGVKEDHFVPKGEINISLGRIIKLIREDIKEFFDGDEDLKLNVKTTKKKKDKKKGDQEKDPMIKYEKIYILTELEKLYTALSFNGKLAINKLLLSPFKDGHSHYSTDGKIFQAYASNEDVEEIVNSKTKLKLYQKWNEDFYELEHLIIEKSNKKIFDLKIASYQELKDILFDPNINPIKDNNPNIANLSEVFIAQRLFEFYIRADEETRIDIIELTKSLLDKDLGTMEFSTALWEWTTRNKTGKAEETNNKLQKIYKNGLTEIYNVFYCEIEELYESDGIAEVVVTSVENLKNRFVRGFDLKMLAKYGIRNLKAAFKLIIYENLSRPGKISFIEPIPRQTYIQKTST